MRLSFSEQLPVSPAAETDPVSLGFGLLALAWLLAALGLRRAEP